ncbi:MAG: phosphoribosylanthranilate isomerase [Eubacterium sp.]|nr:phosphoribosylanthranilate isomerase [Eubacterium sp.]
MAYVKICGLTCPEDAIIVSKAGAHYAGFVFYEKSKRNLDKYAAAQIMQHLAPNIAKIAVLVSPDKKTVENIQTMGFDALQIHGELYEEALSAARIPIWRAYNISGDLPDIEKHEKIKAYVIDGASYGAGKTFDWDRAKDVREKIGDRYLILAGGLNSENVGQAIDALNPDIVDVSSSVEGEFGKDKLKVCEFIRKVKEHG